MELFDLQNKVLCNEYPRVLLFVGEDYALINMYINKLADKLHYVKYVVDDLQSVIEGSKIGGILPENKLYIIRHNKDVITQEKLWLDLEKKIHSNMLIFVFESLDKRTRFYNKYKENVVNFAVQKEDIYIDMLKKTSKLNKQHMSYLGKICGYNYGRSLLEIDKIQQYAKSHNIDENTAFGQLISAKSIYTGGVDVVFDFVNSVLDAKVNMYSYYKILQEQGESNMKLISLLYTAFRNQFIVQTVSRPDTNATGLNQYTINACLKRINRYSEKNLRDAMQLIGELERGVKSGKYDENVIIDYFFAEILL